MLPAASGMPPALGPDGDDPEAVDVAARLAPYLATLPPRRVLLLRLALRAFEWSPFPWRFSRADLESRQDFLRKMDSSTSWIRQDMLLLLKVITGSGYADDPRVRGVVGATARCRVEVDPAAREPDVRGPQPLGDLAPRGAARTATS